MTRRILNRRKLRDQVNAVEIIETTSKEIEPESKTKHIDKKKILAPPKARKPRAKKIKPRIRVRWGIFNSSMKQVAIFDYNMRIEADQKLDELLKNKTGLFVIQPVKEEMVGDDTAMAIDPR